MALLLSTVSLGAQQTARGLMAEAARLRAQRQFGEAIRLYQEALPLCANTGETAQVWFGLASVYRQQGDNPRAVEAYREVTRLEGAGIYTEAAWRQMAELHIEEGDFAAARQAYEQLLVASPDDPNLRVEVSLALARLEAEDGHPEAAAQRLRKLLTDLPQSGQAPHIWAALVQTQVQAEDFTGATASAREGWRLFPGHTTIVLALLDGLRAQGRAQQAIPLAWEFVAQSPEDDNPFQVLADLHRSTRTELQLTEWLQQQSQQPERQAVWLRRLAEVQVEAGNDTGALAAYERLLTLVPDDIEVLREAGETALRVGELAKGEQWLRRCLALAPDDMGVVMSLGEAYLRQGRPDEAMRFWKEAVQYRPDDRDSVRQLGNALQRHQLHQQALQVYAEARQALGDPLAFSAQVGQAHEALLDFAGATREYVAALAQPGPQGAGTAALRLQALTEDAAARPEVRSTLQALAQTGKLPPEAAATLIYARILDGETADQALAALPPSDDQAHASLLAQLGHRLETGGQWHSAALVYGRLLPALRTPTDRAVLALHSSELLTKAGDWRAALQALEGVPADELPAPLARRVRVEQANLLLREGRQPARARELYAAAEAGRGPLSLKARWGLADCAFALGDYASAREQYALLAEASPPPPEAVESLPPLVIGSFYLPFDDVETVTERWPGDDYVAFRLAEMLLREAKFSEAARAFRDLSRQYPASPYANDALERLLLLPALERRAPGAEAYVEAMKAYDRGDADLAVTLLTGITVSPLAEPARLLLADVYLGRGDTEQALATLQALTADFPTSSEAATALLRLAGLQATSDPVAARGQLQEVLRRFPDSPQAVEARILLEMLQQPQKEPPQ